VTTKKVAGALTAHALAETFATLTALPLKPKLSPADVGRLIERNISPHFEIIPLTAAIYSSAIALTIQRGLASGAIYDALHLEGARAAGCNQILTFNLKHFRSLAPQDPMVVAP
jgi:predicted nucleic acid-binding protein